MDAPTGTTNAPKTAPTPTTTSKRPVPPKQPKSTTNPAQSTAGKPPAPETGASRKRPSTSEHENTEAPVSKRGRASGTLLKDLLQQASKILQLAASKADDFAPAVIPHVEGLERMEQIEGKLDDILGKLGKNATSDEIMENHCALGVRLDEILSNVREINEKLEFPDIRKIAFEMNLMNVRMTEMEKHLIPASTHATNAPAELTPSRSEARRGSDNSILRESKPGDPRHSDNSRRTSPRDNDRRTQHSKNSRRTPQPRDSRRTPPPRDSRRTPPQRATRRTPPPRGSRRTPPPRDSRRTPPPRDSRRTPPPRDSRRTPPPRDSRRTSPPRDSRRTPPPRDSRRTSPPRDSRRTPTRSSRRTPSSSSSHLILPPRDTRQTPPTRESHRSPYHEDSSRNRHDVGSRARSEWETGRRGEAKQGRD